MSAPNISSFRAKPLVLRRIRGAVSFVVSVAGLTIIPVVLIGLGALLVATDALAAPLTLRGGGPTDIGSPRFLVGAFGLAALAVAGWIGRHASRRKPSPADVALDRIAQADRYRAPDASSVYCGVVSTVIRSYVEDQFDMPGRDLTTAEFLRNLRDEAPLVLQENRPLVERVLALCDIAQQRRYVLSERELKSAHDAAVCLINVTRDADSAPPGPVDYANPPGVKRKRRR